MSYPVRFDWPAIRALYEAGESPAHIEQRPGMPTRQAIHGRIKKEGWIVIGKPDESMKLIDFEGLSVEQQLVIQEVSQGATQRQAAAIAGVHESTVSDWKAENPRFAKAMAAGKAVKVRRRIGKIEESTDWHSQAWLTERDQDSRAEYAPPASSRGTFTGNTFNVLGHVSLGIERDEIPALPAE